jgi:AsmA protein
MRPIRLLLLSLVVLAAILGVLAAGLYGIARLSWSERQAAAWLTSRLGLPVKVDALAVGYFPEPWLEIDGLSIAAADSETAGRVIEADRVRLVVPWRTALGRGLAITNAKVSAPRLHLVRDASGQANWEELSGRIADLMAGESLAWSLGALDIAGGSVGYRDAHAGNAFEATGVALTGQHIQPARFFPMQARAALQSAGYIFHAAFDGQAMVDPDRDAYAAQALQFDGWLGGGDLPLAGVKLAATIHELTADLAAGSVAANGLEFDGLGVRASLEADVKALQSAPVARFTLNTTAFAPRTIGYSLNRPLPATRDPAALGRALVDLRGEWSEAGLRVDDLHGELDDSRFNGSLWWPAGGLPPQLRLNVDQLELDRYLPPDAPKSRGRAAPQAAVEALLTGLQEVTIDAVISVGRARAAGVTARELKVTLVPDGSVPTGAAP